MPHTLTSIAQELARQGHPNRAHLVMDAVEKLRCQHATIHRLGQEIIAMSRAFTEATKIVLDHDAAATAANVTLGAQNDALAKQVIDLQAQLAAAQSKDVTDAEAAIVDRSEEIQPSPPPAPPGA